MLLTSAINAVRMTESFAQRVKELLSGQIRQIILLLVRKQDLRKRLNLCGKDDG
jgi:hypothetical protein